MRKAGSMIRGVRAMNRKRDLFRNWYIGFVWPPDFLLVYWTPVWHDGRGPYINIILGCIQIARGF